MMVSGGPGKRPGHAYEPSGDEMSTELWALDVSTSELRSCERVLNKVCKVLWLDFCSTLWRNGLPGSPITLSTLIQDPPPGEGRHWLCFTSVILSITALMSEYRLQNGVFASFLHCIRPHPHSRREIKLSKHEWAWKILHLSDFH